MFNRCENLLSLPYIQVGFHHTGKGKPLPVLVHSTRAHSKEAVFSKILPDLRDDLLLPVLAKLPFSDDCADFFPVFILVFRKQTPKLFSLLTKELKKVLSCQNQERRHLKACLVKLYKFKSLPTELISLSSVSHFKNHLFSSFPG